MQMGACPHLSKMTREYLAPDKHSQESRTFARLASKVPPGLFLLSPHASLDLGMQLGWHGERCPLLTQGVLSGLLASFS